MVHLFLQLSCKNESIVSSFQLGQLSELMISLVSCPLDTTLEQVVTLLQKLLSHGYTQSGVCPVRPASYISSPFSADQLREVFSKYGKVEHCRLVRDIGEPHLKKQTVARVMLIFSPVTGRSKGYAFVSYKHTRDAEEAYHVRENFNVCQNFVFQLSLPSPNHVHCSDALRCIWMGPKSLWTWSARGLSQAGCPGD